MPKAVESLTSGADIVADRPLSVAIVGAGVCGLGIGWRLAEAGCRVSVFDRAEAGRGASWAAAGMLAAQAEAEPGEEPLLPLTLASQRMWPDFAERLRTAAGIDPHYRDEGTMVVALKRDDIEQLRFTFDFQRGLGLDIEWLSGTEARTREPCLPPGTRGAIWSPRDHQVDNRRVVAALIEACRRSGVSLHEHSEVSEIAVADGRARGVIADGRLYPADIVVAAAGAWSGTLAGLPEAARVPVRPVKGQMLSVQMDRDEPLLRHVLWAPGIYLVPRADGRLLVGATTEEKGFDTTLTAGGMLSLLHAAWEALPGIAELPIDETWVGFRPGSRDDAPILGRATGVEGLLIATGHHRNGILLLPVTIEAIVRLALTGETMDEITGFGPDRFAAGAAAASGPLQAPGVAGGFQ